jgi:hypothetical protein
MTHCGHCHTCGTELKIVLDGEEWCPKCREYRRYVSHGWADGRWSDHSACPEKPVAEASEPFLVH